MGDQSSGEGWWNGGDSHLRKAWPRFRRVQSIAVLAAVVLLSAACGGASDEERALDLVRDACPTDALDALAGSASGLSIAELATNSANASEHLARAAALDDRWDRLHDAVFTVASFWTRFDNEMAGWADRTVAEIEQARVEARMAGVQRLVDPEAKRVQGPPRMSYALEELAEVADDARYVAAAECSKAEAA